jgi:hypothetical protein
MALQEKKKAKLYAARHNISVSELVESFFLRLEDNDQESHSPLVRQLTGILPESADVEQTYADHLMDKYGR